VTNIDSIHIYLLVCARACVRACMLLLICSNIAFIILLSNLPLFLFNGFRAAIYLGKFSRSLNLTTGERLVIFEAIPSQFHFLLLFGA
jgi:hypothetical protein